MSTKLQDVPHAAILGGVTPRTSTTSVNGSGVDFLAGDGRCFAIQQVGTVTGTSPLLAGKIQESADGSTNWNDIAGATFANVSTTDNVQAISFDRTLRYVRYVGTITGTSPSFPLAVIVGEQKKEI